MVTPYTPREFQVVALLAEDKTQYTLVLYTETYEKQGRLFAVITDGTGMRELEYNTSHLVPVYSEGRMYTGTLVQTVYTLPADGVVTLSNAELMKMVRTALEVAVAQGATPVLK